jgi:hypothetical protein
MVKGSTGSKNTSSNNGSLKPAILFDLLFISSVHGVVIIDFRIFGKHFKRYLLNYNHRKQ